MSKIICQLKLNKQNGGSNSIKAETKNAIRTPLQFNSKLLENEQNNNIHVMSNNKIYNNTYNELNKK